MPWFILPPDTKPMVLCAGFKRIGYPVGET